MRIAFGMGVPWSDFGFQKKSRVIDLNLIFSQIIVSSLLHPSLVLLPY
jgi:hypothetical protein